jgi:ABC-type sugar transport system permease subunit
MVDVRKVINTIAITYAVAIGLTMVLAIVTIALQTAFPSLSIGFLATYNMVRGLTLFMLIFPVALSLIVFGFFGDIGINFLVPIINDMFNMELPTTFGDLSLTQMVGTYNPLTGEGTGVIGQIMVLVETIFPEIS